MTDMLRAGLDAATQGKPQIPSTGAEANCGAGPPPNRLRTQVCRTTRTG